ncbi:glycosyl transferase family 2 [Burkholderia sp. SRS-W-2-2016]|uniref:glycosyltransferase family 2 protein n=1 Tax=Burkholderia sp. SRS-W-2-2016 TaxID=1926878 RepID=UPI00094AD875|nr:glycosyltransferase family A protein [Burkholderia sp. SRS-W-2-2016]OLL32996.1 glycosyl transferase family 2 [Burkholderia sp. SRS-W-2-2016]
MNKTPSVAVIIPFYNGAKWLERAVKSVAEQTIAPAEFIVVNDGSKAEERAALDPLAQKYGFRIIDKSNGGQGSARNVGVAASTSDYICFLDQDDFYLENHIEILVGNLPENDLRLGFVYADLHIADGDGGLVFTSSVKEHSPSNPKKSLIDLLKSDMFVLPSASIITRKAFEAVGGFDEQFMGYEDDDLFLRIFRSGFTNYYVDEPVTVWCIHSESTSYSIRMCRSRFRYFMKLSSQFPDNPDRGLFFFRDCIAPRFGRAFLSDALKATTKKTADKQEVVAILQEYAKVLRQSRYVRRKLKLKFSLVAFVLDYSPPWAIKVMRYATLSTGVRRSLVT